MRQISGNGGVELYTYAVCLKEDGKYVYGHHQTSHTFLLMNFLKCGLRSAAFL